jgi:hypothetical protein
MRLFLSLLPPYFGPRLQQVPQAALLAQQLARTELDRSIRRIVSADGARDIEGRGPIGQVACVGFHPNADPATARSQRPSRSLVDPIAPACPAHGAAD